MSRVGTELAQRPLLLRLSMSRSRRTKISCLSRYERSTRRTRTRQQVDARTLPRARFCQHGETASWIDTHGGSTPRDKRKSGVIDAPRTCAQATVSSTQQQPARPALDCPVERLACDVTSSLLKRADVTCAAPRMRPLPGLTRSSLHFLGLIQR